MAGLGEYTLCQKYACAGIDSIGIKCIATNSPADIVKNIRENKVTGASASIGNIDIPNVDIHVAEITTISQENDSSKTKVSATARAQLILQADNISYDTKLRVFLVKGTSGITRIVTIFPKPTCSCPSTCECYHILPVKLSLGMVPKENSKKLNLTQLRKNTRSRKDRKSGRKRPRPTDTDEGTPGLIWKSDQLCLFYRVIESF